MSTNATAVRLATATAKAVPDTEKGHRVRLFLGYLIAIALVAGIFAYGFNYYTLDSTERPFSPKHALLKPSGVIGVKLGMLGLGMFICIFLYPLRKRWAWLGRQGSSRHWLDNHVLLGLAAPFVIALARGIQVSRLCGHRILDHARGFPERRHRTIPLRADSEKFECGRAFAERGAGNPGQAGRATGATEGSSTVRPESVAESALRGARAEIAHGRGAGAT